MSLIDAGSHVTLHYRVTILDGDEERELVNTFEAAPATLQMGAGQWAEPLEQRLLGLAEGAQVQFDLAPAEAYGDHNPELVQALSAGQLDALRDPGDELAVGEEVRLQVADAAPLRGVLTRFDEQGNGVVDFNHPLAGRTVRVRVQVIGVL